MENTWKNPIRGPQLSGDPKSSSLTPMARSKVQGQPANQRWKGEPICIISCERCCRSPRVPLRHAPYIPAAQVHLASEHEIRSPNVNARPTTHSPMLLGDSIQTSECTQRLGWGRPVVRVASNLPLLLLKHVSVEK